MPKKAKNHIDCRKVVCATCGVKSLKCISLVSCGEGEILQDFLKIFINPDFNSNILSDPVGICISCKCKYFLIKKIFML